MKNLLTWLLVVIAAASANAAALAKPNVVIIVADDLGFADVSFNGGQIPTPNIDRLALQGVRLERFYVCPVCSPTRAGLMTGRYPIRFGLMRAVVPPWRNFGLDTAEKTLPEVLAVADYRHRGAFGKWHLGHQNLKWHPLKRGFTEFVGHYNGAIDYFTHEREGEIDWHHGYEPSDEKGYTTDLIATHAAGFIRRRAKEGPFLCYVPFNAVHTPFQAKDEDIARFKDLKPLGEAAGRNPNTEKALSTRRTVAAMVHSLDEGVGRILAAIDEAGIAEQTLIWFFSDNGGVTGVGDNRPLRGFKASVFEGGIRVAAAVRWPAAGIAGGRKITTPLSCYDVLPTLMGIVGVRDHGGKPLDGVNAYNVLTARRPSLPPRDLYSYIGQSGPENEKITVIEPRWKLVVEGRPVTETRGPHRTYLFRIQDDPNEKNNLAEQHPRVVARLMKKAREFRSLQPDDAIPPYMEGRNAFNPPPRWDIRAW